jgi:hypothetical protein
MNILQTIVFQLKCLLLGLSTDVENIADEHAIQPVTNSVFTTNDMIPHVGRNLGLGRSNDSH